MTATPPPSQIRSVIRQLLKEMVSKVDRQLKNEKRAKQEKLKDERKAKRLSDWATKREEETKKKIGKLMEAMLKKV